MLKKIISKDREQSRFSDLVGVDFSTTATKVVRLKQRVTVTSAGSEEASAPTVVSRESVDEPQDIAPTPAWGREYGANVG